MTALSLNRSDLDMRRGACPALSTPMMTGDGLLARIALTDAISPRELARICRLALNYGNGMIDISARGNLQVRGLTEASASGLDADIRTMNLPLRDGLAIEVPPLAGIDPHEIADPRPLAKAIRDGARGISGLAPKMTIVVDGQGQLRHSNLLADIRLVALSATEWKLLLGGIEKSGRLFNVLDATVVVDTVVDLLCRLAERGERARGRDLADSLMLNLPTRSSALSQGFAIVESDGSLQMPETDTDRTERCTGSSPFGLFALSGSLHAVGIGPAFGQTRAENLIPLCDEAVGLGMQSVKPALDHSLIFFGSDEGCSALSAFAAANDLVTGANDARSSIAACPGSPACTSASMDTHSLARLAIQELRDVLDGSFKLHLTGCPKGCAHPQPTALTMCGTAGGVAFVTGKASDRPFASLPEREAGIALHRIAALIRTERRPHETTAECIARLDQDRLAHCLMSGNP
jgi:precorrin-3B synthase